MRTKAIIGFIVLTILFFSGGIYITSTNNLAIKNLENVVTMSEEIHRRDDLMNKIKLVQADLLLADSPHASDINTVLFHGEEARVAANSCLSCHHSEEMMQRFSLIQKGIDQYLQMLRRLYTIRDTQEKIHAEITAAFDRGEKLHAEVSNLSASTAHKIPDKITHIRAEIARNQRLTMTLVFILPFLALIPIFLFIKRFTTSISVLTTATGKIKEGDLTHTITEPLHDEFQELATAFNQMAASLKKQCEQVLSAENRYKTLFDSAVDAIFILDAEGDQPGKIVAANLAAAEMHGFTVDELLNLKMQDLDTPESAAKLPERLRLLVSGEKIEGRVEHRRKDGTFFPVEFSAGLVEINGTKHILAFDRDITLRTRTEEALLRSLQLATVGEMAAGLAHEIKNPLAGIKISMEVLVNELDIPQPDKEIFLRIIKEILRIETLLRNLLNYARPPLPTFSLIDLNAQIENCLKNSEMILKSPEYAGENRKRIEFHKNLADYLPPINADAAQLQQVFLNLFLNAIEAIPEDGTITVTTRPLPDNRVQVEVADTGKGMTPEACAGIFQPFYTTKPKGSGLGLAITSRLVELHQGDIKVVSTPGLGTTFLITFPVTQEQIQEVALP